jgi:nicotinate phosphoribosyltransferase
MASGLLTDLYQITMAYGYWKTGKHEQKTVFHWFYRKNPFGGDYTVACGLQPAIDFVLNWQFSGEEVAYLSKLKGNDGQPLFEPAFLDYLAQLRFTGDIYAVEEGTIVFPHLPLLRIEADLIQAQLLETVLLTILNFQTLIATKSARVKAAAGADTVLEFGLRRAQGMDGGISASRAAYVGGADATSNVLAGMRYDIPVKGTHAHAWVMSFPTESEAFAEYARAMPNNCVFLVDTYDTLKGVAHAIEIGKKLQAQGHKMQGIRLDSGDLVSLSQKARVLLDTAGFADAQIVASDDLNEYKIRELKQAGAKIDVWGVGTQLVTAYDQPALGGVYKLAAIRNPETKAWDYKLKLSENPIKVSNPGLLQVRRFFLTDNHPFGDMILDEEETQPSELIQSWDGREITTKGRIFENLLKPILQNGQLVYQFPSIHQTRQKTISQVALFKDTDFKLYPVGLEQKLNNFKQKLIFTLKK